MTCAFKHCETHLQQKIAAGSIRLRPLIYYRETENQAVRDPNDGSITHFIEDKTITAGEKLVMGGNGLGPPP